MQIVTMIKKFREIRNRKLREAFARPDEDPASEEVTLRIKWFDRGMRLGAIGGSIVWLCLYIAARW